MLSNYALQHAHCTCEHDGCTTGIRSWVSRDIGTDLLTCGPGSPFFPFFPLSPGGPGSPGGPITGTNNKSILATHLNEKSRVRAEGGGNEFSVLWTKRDSVKETTRMDDGGDIKGNPWIESETKLFSHPVSCVKDIFENPLGDMLHSYVTWYQSILGLRASFGKHFRFVTTSVG